MGDQQAFVRQAHLAVGQDGAALQQGCQTRRRHQTDAATADVKQGCLDQQDAAIAAPDRADEFDRPGDRRCQAKVLAPLESQQFLGQCRPEGRQAALPGLRELAQLELDLHLVNRRGQQ
jgi:hypothetical protein